MFNTEQFELGDKVAVITGGTEGIGRAIAEILGRAGARVVVTSRRADAVEATAVAFRTQDIDALGVATDVRDPEAVANLVSVAAKRFGCGSAGGTFHLGFLRQ